MAPRGFPGGALAVVRKGRLVYARGYGWADREAKEAVTPTSLFRIASISKPITALAILKLVQDGRLKLESRAFALIGSMFRDRPLKDERLREITVLQLLQHTGGWDRDKSFDPMFRCRKIAAAEEVPTPPGATSIIRYMCGEPLDLSPGDRYAYSNFGYSVLGRIIEQVANSGYEDYVRRTILQPMGIDTMRRGATKVQAQNEVRYYTRDNKLTESVFSDDNEKVPVPYGGFYLEAMDAHGGWIGSVQDLAHLAAALDTGNAKGLLKSTTLATMYAPPEAPAWRKKSGELSDAYYGCGWMVRPMGKGANYWHSGSLPGTATLLVRRWDGLSWVVLFNQRSDQRLLPDSAIDPALHRAADRVTEWPEGTLL